MLVRGQTRGTQLGLTGKRKQVLIGSGPVAYGLQSLRVPSRVKEFTMLRYYLELALRSLRRNVVLTTLMVAAVGVGIGTYCAAE